MGFVEIENMGKAALEQFPVIKRSAKRAYQLASVATSNEKIKSDGDIACVSPDDGFEYFYGYYDKSPWDATDRYMICIKAKQAYKSVAPKEPAIVGVIDTHDNNKFIQIGVTHSWNVQQSCMAQWVGPDFGTKIIYNDFRNGKYCSVIYNWENKTEERVLPLPVYDVARDGSFALSLDFSRLHRMRPGYGYSNLPDETKGILCPDQACIWKMDIPTGEVTELFKYTDFASFEPDETMVGAEHKVNHLMISPNGKRFMVLHRWFQKGRKHTRLVTVNVDRTEMYNLSDDVFVSHCYWKNDQEILSFLRKKETGNHYYLMKDKTQEYKMFWPELNTDGHCSYSPDGRFIITDTYPNRKRIASVYLCTEEDNRSRRIARVFSPFRYDNDCRCDLHPRWNREGTKVCIDSVHEGRRGLYIIEIDKSIRVKRNDTKTQPSTHNFPLISFIIPSYNSEKTIERCLNSLLNQTDCSWEAIVINDGSTDNTVNVLRKYNEDNRIRCYSQNNSGPGIARNNGIHYAKGKYISFLDSDDFIEPDFVSIMRNKIEFTCPDVVFYETSLEKENGEILRVSCISKYSQDSIKKFINRQMSGSFSWGATKIIKKSIIVDTNASFGTNDVGEEAVFTFVILRASSKIEFVNKPLYHYVQSCEGQHKKGNDDPIGKAVSAFDIYLHTEGIKNEFIEALTNMAYKALCMALYRCAINNSFFIALKKMHSLLKEYKSNYNYFLVDKTVLNKSLKMLYPFIQFNMALPIFIVSKLRANTKD